MHKTIFLISFEYFPISQAGLARHAKAMIDRLLKYRGFKAIIAVPKNNKIKLNKHVYKFNQRSIRRRKAHCQN